MKKTIHLLGIYLGAALLLMLLAQLAVYCMQANSVRAGGRLAIALALGFGGFQMLNLVISRLFKNTYLGIVFFVHILMTLPSVMFAYAAKPSGYFEFPGGGVLELAVLVLIAFALTCMDVARFDDDQAPSSLTGFQ